MLIKQRYALILATLVATGVFAQPASDRKTILAILERQTNAWNQGKLDQFMIGYWQSDSLKYIGKNGITYGWKNALANYQKNYPDADSRGTLRFEILSVDVLSADAAFVVGKFFLTRPKKGDASGHFTLLWRKINGEWVIVADHSS